MSSDTSLKVMVADDSDPVRQRMAALLGEIPGVEVIAEVADVPSAIESALRLRPDAVMLDLSMPGGSGLDVLASIRSSGLPAVVVILTSHTEPEYEQLALSGGANAFFNKSREFLKAVDFVRGLRDWHHRKYKAS